MRKRYVIDVPQPQGRTLEVEVDPARLTSRVITEIYEYFQDRGRSSPRRQRAHGIESPVQLTFDPSDLIERFEEMREAAKTSLGEFGDAGETVSALYEQFELSELLRAVVDCDAQKARAILEPMMVAFQGLTCRLAEDLQRKDQTVEQMSGSVADLANLMDGKSEIHQNFYFLWAMSAVELNSAVDQLEQIERHLQQLDAQVQATKQEWSARLSLDSSNLKTIYEFLNAGEHPFIDTAIAYRGEEAHRNAMERLVIQARRYIDEAKTLERSAAAAWNALQETSAVQVQSLASHVDRFIQALTRATGELHAQEEKMGPDILRPCTYRESPDKPTLINEADYGLAIERMQNAKWGPRQCRRRLRSLAESIQSMLGDQPQLPEAFTRMLSLAEHALRSCEEQLSADALTPTAAVEISSSAPFRSKRGEDDGTAKKGHLDAARLTELYELITCAGYVLTSLNAKFLNATTVWNALQVLIILGSCTEEERIQYFPKLKELYERDREIVHEMKHVNSRLHASGKRWISFKSRTTWCMKLTHQSRDEAQALMKKHQMTEQRIRSGYAVFREAKEDAWKAKKK